MNLKSLIELLGALGVIASLIFVGLQLRLEAEATRSATVLQIKDAWVELNLAEATSSELSLAFQDVYENGLEGASFENQSHILGFYRALFHNQSNAYYQYRIGVLDEELWAPHLEELEDMSKRTVPLKVWERVSHLYDHPFRELFSSLVAMASPSAKSDVEDEVGDWYAGQYAPLFADIRSIDPSLITAFYADNFRDHVPPDKAEQRANTVEEWTAWVAATLDAGWHGGSVDHLVVKELNEDSALVMARWGPIDERCDWYLVSREPDGWKFTNHVVGECTH